MKRVIIESPYRGIGLSDQEYDDNTQYALECAAFALAEGFAPFASHLLYPPVLDDTDERQREQGMQAGWAWLHAADEVWLCVDRGVSPGMVAGAERAAEAGIPVYVLSIENGGWRLCVTE